LSIFLFPFFFFENEESDYRNKKDGYK
jgi:hypothetical protein